MAHHVSDVNHHEVARRKGLDGCETRPSTALPHSQDGLKKTVSKKQSAESHGKPVKRVRSVGVDLAHDEDHVVFVDPSSFVVTKKQSATKATKPAPRLRTGTSRKARPSSRVSQDSGDTQSKPAGPSSVEKTVRVVQPKVRESSQHPNADDYPRGETQNGNVIGRLVFKCRVRSQLMSAKNRIANQMSAMDRLQRGEVKRGKTVIQREPTLDDVMVAMTTKSHLAPHLNPMEAALAAVSKEIEGLARELRVWRWVDAVRGFGALGLGLIVGATGDLSKYAKPAKVWKRMGVGLVGTERQRRTTDVEKALAMGYNPRRRSLMHTIGDSLLKQNGISGDGYYRGVYDARKVYAETAHPDWTKAHRHMDALRYMEKRLLRHLWQVWKRQAGRETQPEKVSPAALDAQAADYYVGSLTSSFIDELHVHASDAVVLAMQGGSRE